MYNQEFTVNFKKFCWLFGFFCVCIRGGWGCRIFVFCGGFFVCLFVLKEEVEGEDSMKQKSISPITT